ncbi:MAG: hypothetical protein Q7J58_20260 [Hydrogenophaga sp.]|uniref:hypothetical protein n=1 Tax=Hydrogenophaga sp. TaxID=1904254 RepID=UPI00271C1579|nr:hypothetical protein [Hydrogenophaga sp.]MDO9571689.1 hypothetical protein [Hydrogenophaga sp.]MDP3373384.1 hypothetical protein [Hydrogenophaga sp.]
MASVRLLPMPVAQVRRWLHLLWLCTLFSALHGTLGAWVVPVWSGQAAVEICTPQGMQWVALENSAPGGESDLEGLAQPCVWSSAHTAMVWAPPLLRLRAPGHTSPLDQGDVRPGPHSDSAERVLLMSAMRAPPLAV